MIFAQLLLELDKTRMLQFIEIILGMLQFVMKLGDGILVLYKKLCVQSRCWFALCLLLFVISIITAFPCMR